MGRVPGSLCRVRCNKCRTVDLVTGTNGSYLCAGCRPVLSPFRAAQKAAHKAVRIARRRGELADPRTLGCTDCERASVEYDHRDYRQPLKVDPVCRRCNLRRGPALFEVVEAHGQQICPREPRNATQSS